MDGKVYLSCIDVIKTDALTQPIQHLVNADYAQSIGGKIVFYTAEDPLTRGSHSVVRACIRDASYDGVIFFRMNQFLDDGRFNFSALDELVKAGLEVHFARESLAIRTRTELLKLFPDLYCFETTQPRACGAILDKIELASAAVREDQQTDLAASERIGRFVRRRSTCRLCHSRELELVLPLAPIPIISSNSEVAAKDAREVADSAPLELYACRSCGHIQQIYIVDPEVLYRRYLYKTSISLGLTEHFSRSIADLLRRIDRRNGDLVVEVGSNNGAVLKIFRDHGFAVLGVEPAQALAAAATAGGLTTIGDFFSANLAQCIRHAYGPARIVIANNVVANIDDLDDFAAGIRTLLAPNGLFMMETQNALEVFERNLLDVIYHEHVSYFLVAPLEKFFRNHGLVLVDVEFTAAKGGSMRVFVQLSDGAKVNEAHVQGAISREQDAGIYGTGLFSAYRNRVASLCAEVEAFVTEERAKGKRIVAYGASVGCVSLLEQFNLADKIRFVVDDNATKDHIVVSNVRIPIRSASALVDEKIDWAVVLAWRYASDIAARNQTYTAQGGRFAVPLPRLSVV